MPSVSALAHIPYTNTTFGKNLFESVLDNSSQSNSNRIKNVAFVYDYNIKQIGIVTDEYVYVHSLLSGKEDFRSSRNDNPLPQTSNVAEDKKSLQSLSQAYYETARYMLLNNKKEKVK